jgi:hypothetical protein
MFFYAGQAKEGHNGSDEQTDYSTLEKIDVV